MQLANLPHGHEKNGEFKDRVDTMTSSIKIMGLIKQIQETPMMETIVFKEACGFFDANTTQVIEIIKKKYSGV